MIPIRAALRLGGFSFSCILFSVLYVNFSLNLFAQTDTPDGRGFHQYQQNLPSTVPPLQLQTPTSTVDRITPYSDPNVAVIEFDQNGDLWDCNKANSRCQDEYAVDFIRKARTQIPLGEHLTVLTFIHGWKHNAKWNDENYLHLRQSIDCLNWGEKGYFAAYGDIKKSRMQTEDAYDLSCKGIRAQPTEHYIGLYIGWQGTPSSHKTGQGTLLTVYKQVDRTSKNKAMQAVIDSVANATKDGRDPPASIIVAGHSMGGLLNERIALAELKSFPSANSQICVNGREGRVSPVDLFVLVNPANTTSVGLQIIQSLRARPICHARNLSANVPFPYIISLHSLSDSWTGVYGALGLHTLNFLHFFGVRVPFPPVDPATLPTDEDNVGRSFISPDDWRVRGRPFHQTQFLMSACFDESESVSPCRRTGDRICDRVLEKAKEIKVKVVSDNSLPTILQPDGVDMGTYEYLRSICDPALEGDDPKSCAGERKVVRDRAQVLLTNALAPLMVVPKFTGSPNPLLDLYARFDPGCRKAAESDPTLQVRPLCADRKDPDTLPPANLTPQAPWNNTGYWAVNVFDDYIHGHSAFWTDNFSALIIGFSRSLR